MNPGVTAFIVLSCTLGAALLGIWLKAVLPGHHLDVESKETATRATGFVVTMSALVLGLVVASAKGSFDVENTMVEQNAASLLTIDRQLARYGPETAPLRDALRTEVVARLAQRFSEGATGAGREDGAEVVFALERVVDRIAALVPQTEAQRWLRSRALTVGSDLLEARWLDQDREGTLIPRMFLGILISWITLIFMTFGLFAPRHATVGALLTLCALAVSTALFLILELYQPFDGIICVSLAPLEYALAHMGR